MIAADTGKRGEKRGAVFSYSEEPRKARVSFRINSSVCGSIATPHLSLACSTLTYTLFNGIRRVARGSQALVNSYFSRPVVEQDEIRKGPSNITSHSTRLFSHTSPSPRTRKQQSRSRAGS